MLLQMPIEMGAGIAVILLLLIVVILAILSFIFWVMMLIDCVRRDFKDKLVWVIILIFASGIGAILYYFIVKKADKKKR